MINVNDFKENHWSQYGEDGILDYLLQQITRTGFVVEFGAADGLFCSNTAHRWLDLADTDALLIEGNPDYYRDMVKNVANSPRVQTEQAYVTNIDDHTTRVADICSIDVDGNDYHIAWRMQTPHQIVVIEHNPTVPPHLDMIGVEGSPQGTSARPICHIMHGKGYTLVAATKTNLIFLHGDWDHIYESRLEVLFDYSALNYVVTSYDGSYDMIGEFGYGFERPTNLRIKGPKSMVRKTIDGQTKEWMRQMTAMDVAKRDNK